MIFVRYLLPALIAVAGLVVLASGGDTGAVGGAALIGAGAAVYLLNWLFRVGVGGDADREREEAARRYFDEHGRWPDEAPGGRSGGSPPAPGRRS